MFLAIPCTSVVVKTLGVLMSFLNIINQMITAFNIA